MNRIFAARSDTANPVTRPLRFILGAFLAAALLGGCASGPDRSGVRPPPPDGPVHLVRPGDTVYRLSKHYRASVEAIREANLLDRRFTIHVGQRLVIPIGEHRAAPRRSVAAAPQRPEARAPRREAAARPAPKRAPVAFAPVQPMLRPAEGEIVSEFGAKTGGAANDGIDIATPAGAPVRAAADGEVAFVSDPGSRLGSVVLVQHDGGIVTIYGRVADVTVRPGQRVARGAEIARVANARGGRSTLHFELRRDSEPIDPTPYL